MLCLCLAAQNALPQDESALLLGDGEATVDERPLPTAFGAWDFLRMLAILAFVVALIYGFFFMLKRLSSSREEASLIRIIETRVLAGNRSVHLAEVGTHVYLLGSAETGVNLIAEINDRESLDDIRLKLSEKEVRQRPAAFAEILRGMFRKNEQPPPALNPDTELDFIRKQKERLKKLT